MEDLRRKKDWSRRKVNKTLELLRQIIFATDNLTLRLEFPAGKNIHLAIHLHTAHQLFQKLITHAVPFTSSTWTEIDQDPHCFWIRNLRNIPLAPLHNLRSVSWKKEESVLPRHVVTWFLEFTFEEKPYAPDVIFSGIPRKYAAFEIKMDIPFQQGTPKLDKPMLRPQDMKVIHHEATMQMEANKQTCRSCAIRRIGLLRCATCKHAYYCNVDCQRSDYSKHKVECKTMARKKEELELEKQCDYTGSVETSIFLYRKKSIFSSFPWSLDWNVFFEDFG